MDVRAQGPFALLDDLLMSEQSRHLFCKARYLTGSPFARLSAEERSFTQRLVVLP